MCAQSSVFPRHCHSDLPQLASGHGCYLVDSNGKQYLDGSGGAAVSCLGHGDREIISAVKAQLECAAYAHNSFFTSEPAEELADLLTGYAPDAISRVYFVSGGSEAVEASIKLARQYFVERGEQQRKHIIARQQSYHGNTLGALAVGGNQWRRAAFDPLLMQSSHVSACYEYRGMRPNEMAIDYAQRLANELEAEILRLGEDSVMAFIAEPVVGATLGAVPAVEGYFKRIREICDRYDVLLILDEVMCGMGRTGYFYACEHDAIQPDIITIAKGLGAGYQPIGAMLCTDKIYNIIKTGSGFFQHGHTYLAHPTACAAGLAVVKALHSRGLVKQCATRGDQLVSLLQERLGAHEFVGDIRGRGLFIGVELVQNKESKAPFDPDLKIHSKLKQAAFEAGLVCYPMGGTLDGKRGDHVLLAPAFVIDQTQLEELVSKLEGAINQVTSAVNAGRLFEKA